METNSSFSCLENSMDRRAWWASLCDHKKLDRTEHERACAHARARAHLCVHAHTQSGSRAYQLNHYGSMIQILPHISLTESLTPHINPLSC